MQVLAKGPGHFDLRFSYDELGMVNNALNECCNGVQDLADDGEFQTRVGWERGELQRLLNEVGSALRNKAV